MSYFQLLRGVTSGINVTTRSGDINVRDRTTLEVREAGFIEKRENLAPIGFQDRKLKLLDMYKHNEVLIHPIAWYDSSGCVIYVLNDIHAERMGKDTEFLSFLPTNPHLE